MRDDDRYVHTALNCLDGLQETGIPFFFNIHGLHNKVSDVANACLQYWLCRLHGNLQIVHSFSEIQGETLNWPLWMLSTQVESFIALVKTSNAKASAAHGVGAIRAVSSAWTAAKRS